MASRSCCTVTMACMQCLEQKETQGPNPNNDTQTARHMSCLHEDNRSPHDVHRHAHGTQAIGLHTQKPTRQGHANSWSAHAAVAAKHTIPCVDAHICKTNSTSRTTKKAPYQPTTSKHSGENGGREGLTHPAATGRDASRKPKPANMVWRLGTVVPKGRLPTNNRRPLPMPSA